MAWVLTSWPLLRSAQTPFAAAVSGGVQDRNACGTPSTLTVWPLTVTLPPSTGSTARTPASLLTLASCAALIPVGVAAIRSGTKSCRGGPPAEPGTFSDFGTDPLPAATPGGGVLVKSKELPDGPGPALAGPAKAASVTHAAAVTTGSCTTRRLEPARAARHRVRSSTMY